ncbi:hypothetical protein GTR04_0126 [Trichophyton interdigitale]|nr:hypothetical protein GTR04_0126 [Trichophyton interdigitale]
MILPVPGARRPRIGVDEDDREALLGQGHSANAGTEPSPQDAATSSPPSVSSPSVWLTVCLLRCLPVSLAARPAMYRRLGCFTAARFGTSGAGAFSQRLTARRSLSTIAGPGDGVTFSSACLLLLLLLLLLLRFVVSLSLFAWQRCFYTPSRAA